MMPSRTSGQLTFAKVMACFSLLWAREQVAAFQRVSSSALVLPRHSIDSLAWLQGGGRLQRLAASRDATEAHIGDYEQQSSHESLLADPPTGPFYTSPDSAGGGRTTSVDLAPAMNGDEGEGLEDDDDDDDNDGDPFPIWEGMGAFQAGEMEAPPPWGVIIVDGFCDYLGRRCARLLKEAGYAVVEVMSEHMLDVVIKDEEANVFRPPEPGAESRWAAHLPFPLAAVLCESDAGLATAERLQAALLGPRFGVINEARRDKFLMNEAVREAGLTAVRQVKTGDWNEEAEVAFAKILGTRKYGTPGAVNDEVLVQELLEGVEFAVDTVSREGEHKVMAIWRYDKRPANGAPFVYFSTQLMRSDGAQEQRLVEYVRRVLDALGVTFGPTHTEVMMVGAQSGEDTSQSPTLGMPVLVEVNTRWHLTDFAPVTNACVGYNAVEETLSAYLDPERFGALPRDPTARVGAKHGRVVHLVSYVEGSLEGIEHEEEIRGMESFAGIDVYSDPGREGTGWVKRTVDIRSDAGWVHLVHESAEVIERDYARIVELMPTMFRVRAAEGDREDARTPGRAE